MKKPIKINTAIGGKFNKDLKQKNGLTIDNNTPAVIINNKKYLLAKLIDGNMVAINVFNFHIDYLINSSYEIQIEIKTNKIN